MNSELTYLMGESWADAKRLCTVCKNSRWIVFIPMDSVHACPECRLGKTLAEVEHEMRIKIEKGLISDDWMEYTLH